MNNENTILDPMNATDSKANENVTNNAAQQAPVNGKASTAEKAAYAAGGAVVGAGMAMAGQAMAAPKAEKPETEPEKENDDDAQAAANAAISEDGKENADSVANEDSKEEANVAAASANEDGKESANEGVTIETNGATVHVTGDAKIDVEDGEIHVTVVQDAKPEEPETPAQPEVQQPSPEPEDVIVATSTGVRVAHVDDDMSFSQAFADARAQVGPGGVFEWHGRAYGTYYKEEWDNMSAAERAEYQASINYKEVLSDDEIAQHHNDVAQHNHDNVHHDQTAEIHHNTEHTQDDSVSDTSDEVDVRVIETGEVDVDGDGVMEAGAVLDVNGNPVIVLDMNHDGIADVAVSDLNGNGELDNGEAADISDAGMPMPNDGSDYMAQADDAPDYMNDANVGLYEA